VVDADGGAAAAGGALSYSLMLHVTWRGATTLRGGESVDVEGGCVLGLSRKAGAAAQGHRVLRSDGGKVVAAAAAAPADGAGGGEDAAAADAAVADGGEGAAALAEARCKKAELLNKVWTKKVLPLLWARCEAFDGALGAHLAAQQ